MDFSKIFPDKETIHHAALIALVFAVLVIPDYGNLGDPFRDGAIRYSCYALSALIFIYLRKANPWLAAFAAWSFFRWVLDDFQSHGFLDCMMLIAVTVYGYEINKFGKNAFFGALIAYIALGQGIYALFQVYGIDPFLNMEPAFKNRAIGFMGHNTELGPMVALGAVYFFSKARKWEFLVCMAAVFASDSTMTVLCFLAGCLYVIHRFSRKAAIWTASAGSVLGLAVFLFKPTLDFFSFTGRMTVWPLALKAWGRSPIIGNGPGGWLGHLYFWGATHDQIGMDWGQVHNDFMQVLVEQGMIGFLIVCFGLYFLMKRAAKTEPYMGAWVVLLCANALGNFPMHLASFGLIAGWLCVSIWSSGAGGSDQNLN